jgi:hypothetical protein
MLNYLYFCPSLISSSTKPEHVYPVHVMLGYLDIMIRNIINPFIVVLGVFEIFYIVTTTWTSFQKVSFLVFLLSWQYNLLLKHNHAIKCESKNNTRSYIHLRILAKISRLHDEYLSDFYTERLLYFHLVFWGYFQRFYKQMSFTKKTWKLTCSLTIITIYRTCTVMVSR